MAADCRSSHAGSPFCADPPGSPPTSRTPPPQHGPAIGPQAALRHRQGRRRQDDHVLRDRVAGCQARTAHGGGGGRRAEQAAGPVRRQGALSRHSGGAARDGISSISIDPDQALLEWLQALGGRVPGRLLASSGTFQYFAAAAPGAKEIVSMVKIWQLTRGAAKRRGGYDLVIVDAPATGHALGMLGSPGTFGAIARVGPIAGQTPPARGAAQGRAPHRLRGEWRSARRWP